MTLIQSLKIGYVKVLLGIRHAVINTVQKCLFAPSTDPKKILVHRIGTFGDSIVALPAISLIRKRYPDARMEFVTTYATALNLSVIIKEGIFDAVHLIDKKSRKSGIQTLKHGNYDLYIEIPQNYGLIKTLRNMLITRFVLGIRSGFGWDEGMTKLFVKEQLMFYPPLRESDRFVRNMARNGIVGEIEYPIKTESPGSEALHCFEGKKVIALVIGTNVPANMWPLESWQKLARSLHEKGFAIAVIGGDQEKERANTTVEGLEYGYNFCGAFSIAQSAGFLQLCTGAICHDTGAMHLAYAVKTPLVAMFSPRQLSSKWFPPSEGTYVVMNMVECAGCFRKKCDDNICMKQIDPVAVERRLLEIIGGKL